MDSMSVTGKGQVTIPQDIRRLMGIHGGSQVCFMVVDDHVEMRVLPSVDKSPASGFGMLRSKKPAVSVDFDPAVLLSPGRDGN